MNTEAAAAGKRYWCEKSVYTITNQQLVDAVFPRARYICLFRNCLDQVDSAMQTLERDPSGQLYGYTQFIQNANNNTLHGLVDYWIWMTTNIMNYEAYNQTGCFRLRYEDLAQDSEATAKALFSFLAIDWEDDLLERVFLQQHKIGAGDHKITQTSRIETGSVGKSLQFSVADIDSQRIAQVNALHQQLGYAALS